MDVAGWVWAVTLVGLGALLAFDLMVIGRRPHEPTVRESTAWVLFYVGLAVLFGLAVWTASSASYAGEFFAGWLTEYSLSVDNLFVFMIIMGRLAVPRQYQQTALFVGIVLALILRGAFIAAGAAVVSRFSWVFYLFGAFLVYTAIKLARQGETDDGDFKENALIRWTRRVLPLSADYHGARLTAPSPKGRGRILTPMVVVLVAIGTTDLVFALDSIPAIFGLTKEAYLVFTVNVFALMGLRQLYFLLGNLLDRLVYLSLGLAGVLGFIGTKLVLEALHDNHVGFINGGRPVGWAPEIPITVSLGVVLGTLAVATVASLLRSRELARAEALAAVVPGAVVPSPGAARRPVTTAPGEPHATATVPDARPSNGRASDPASSNGGPSGTASSNGGPSGTASSNGRVSGPASSGGQARQGGGRRGQIGF